MTSWISAVTGTSMEPQLGVRNPAIVKPRKRFVKGCEIQGFVVAIAFESPLPQSLGLTHQGQQFTHPFIQRQFRRDLLQNVAHIPE